MKARTDLLRASVEGVFALLAESRVDDEACRAAVAGEMALWRAVRGADSADVPPRFATVHRRGAELLDRLPEVGDGLGVAVERIDAELLVRSMETTDEAERPAPLLRCRLPARRATGYDVLYQSECGDHIRKGRNVDYVDFTGAVLAAAASLRENSVEAMTIGVRPDEIALKLPEGARGSGRELEEAILSALSDLEQLGLVDQQRSKKGYGMGFFKVTPRGVSASRDPIAFWGAICDQQLDPRPAELLRVVNRLSTMEHPNSPEPGFVFGDAIASELDWPQAREFVPAVAKDLAQAGLITDQSSIGLTRLRANFRGLVWETRRMAAGEARRILTLVAYGETTSVELKREVETGTKDQKAELVKDLLALANTQASPPHLLLVGFDDKTRSYHGAPNPRMTQEHLEQLLEEYTAPVLNVRYRVIDLPEGPVGEVEVVRERTKLPYRVATSVGDKKRIEKGTLFVRHGSLAVPATPDEEAAIEAEGDHARQAMAGEGG